jgi:hypothetical protein
VRFWFSLNPNLNFEALNSFIKLELDVNDPLVLDASAIAIANTHHIVLKMYILKLQKKIYIKKL